MIKQEEFLEINGRKQFISVRSKAEGLPLLLYLHGGPGDAALPLVRKYNSELEKCYTFVVWEQRGAGKSYYPFAENEPVSMRTFAEDIHSLVRYLLRRFGQEKLYLLGHSWGSVLGMTYVMQYPQLVHTYIGCGQVLDMQEGARRQYEYALLKCLEHGDRKAAERLEHTDISYTQDTWLEDLLFVTKLVVKYKGSLYGRSSYNRLVMDFLFSPAYSLKDLLNREKGSLQSIRLLWPELMKINFMDVKAFEVPVIFMEGRHDYHVSSTLVGDYFETLKTPGQLYWFEKSCHFPQWSEAEKFNGIMKELAEKCPHK